MTECRSGELWRLSSSCGTLLVFAVSSLLVPEDQSNKAVWSNHPSVHEGRLGLGRRREVRLQEGSLVYVCNIQ